MYIYMYCVRTFVCVCIYIYVCIYVCVFMYVCMYVLCMCVFMYLCIFLLSMLHYSGVILHAVIIHVIGSVSFIGDAGSSLSICLPFTI